MKKFFGIKSAYKFERMDLMALFMAINTLVIILWDKGAYVGLPVNVVGLIWDLKEGGHINNVVLRLSLIVMNVYFLTL